MMSKTGPGRRNAITDVASVVVGNADDQRVRTGVTVVRCADGPFACAVDVRGGGPGTRESDALTSHTLVGKVDAVVLSGGSVYGLAAADGVAATLGHGGQGFALAAQDGIPPSPIVPTAILYDLANGGEKDWGLNPPYGELGATALAACSPDFEQGRSGAGMGAMAGTAPGGLGSASVVTDDGLTVGALVAVNSFGSVRMPGTDAFWAWPFEQNWDGGPEFGGARPPASFDLWPEDWGAAKTNPQPRQNTTLAIIATDVPLAIGDLQRLAIMAQDGLGRAIRPAHAPFDGDVVFAMSTAVGSPQHAIGPDETDLVRAWRLTRLGSLAADCLARAVARGVWAAEQQARD